MDVQKKYKLEKDLKRVVKSLLDARKVKWFMPVPVGFGENAVDFLCTYMGHSIALETKAEKNKPTVQQWDWLIDTSEYGGSCAVVYCLQDVIMLLDAVDNGHQYICPLVQKEIAKRRKL